jgi:hypothetical protein
MMMTTTFGRFSSASTAIFFMEVIPPVWQQTPSTTGNDTAGAGSPAPAARPKTAPFHLTGIHRQQGQESTLADE